LAQFGANVLRFNKKRRMQTQNIFRVESQRELIKLIGSSYFIVLALANATGMLLNKTFGFFDFILLIAVALPPLINRNWFYQFFGFTNVLLWLLIMLVVLSKMQAMATTDFVIGFGLSLSAIAFGLILMYIGLPSKKAH